ncbi:hypothetical protein L218DRAFT_609942 [Marasmius fiardii PR-910]|nr:hypothetical protein L218DRAFT_609942 [Marasmius fiardii PR-910]
MQSASVSIQPSSFIDVQGSGSPYQSRASTSRSTGNGPGPDRNGQNSQGNRADPAAGLSFAQRLYASALAATKQENAPPADIGHKQTASTSATLNDHIPDRVSTNSPPALSMAALSLNADSDITSPGSGGSLYKRVAGQTHSPSHTSHAPSHRTRSLPLSSPHISNLDNGTQTNVHRTSTMPITTPASFVKPYTYTPPSETPHRVLVARPPVKPIHSHQRNAGTTTSWAGGQPNVVFQPLLPHKTSPIYSVSPCLQAQI